MDIYQELGIEPVINAAGTVTIYGGSLMPAEVLEAMESASRNFVDIHELHRAAGKRIAQLIGVEAAHICASASAGITLMAAACLAGTDPERIHRLPNTEGMHNRFIVQRSQRNHFDHAIEIAGGVLVEINADENELRNTLEQGDAAAVSYTHAWSTIGHSLSLIATARIAHEYGIPLILDAAAEVPPVENLSRFIKEGADLVVFSGGKDIRGPQASGFILGRKDLVEACRVNDSPNVDGIARGMKTGKEEIAGLVKAVELYISQDQPARMAEWEDQINYLLREFSGLSGVKAERQLPAGVGQLIPHVALSFNETKQGLKISEVVEKLRNGRPPIAVRLVEIQVGAPVIWVCVQTLKKGEEQVVGQHIKEILLIER